MSKKDKIKLPKGARVLGWDPGRINTATALYSLKDGVIETDVIEGTGNDLVKNLEHFADRVERQLEWFDPDACVVERYQLRAGKGFIGNMEAVNQMIGVIFEQCRMRDIPCVRVTPSVHKTWAGKYMGAEKKKGKLAMETCPEFKDLKTDHEADAANVARWALHNVFEEEK
jgi:Holliday junction resolvasome RuvABC endonuclease subunit